MTENWLQGQLTGLNWFWHGEVLAVRSVVSFFAFSQKRTVDVSSAGSVAERKGDEGRAG